MQLCPGCNTPLVADNNYACPRCAALTAGRPEPVPPPRDDEFDDLFPDSPSPFLRPLPVRPVRKTLEVRVAALVFKVAAGLIFLSILYDIVFSATENRADTWWALFILPLFFGGFAWFLALATAPLWQGVIGWFNQPPPGFTDIVGKDVDDDISYGDE
jgi:hypothetical protein